VRAVPRKLCEGMDQEGDRFTYDNPRRSPGISCRVCQRDFPDRSRRGLVPRHTRVVLEEENP